MKTPAPSQYQYPDAEAKAIFFDFEKTRVVNNVCISIPNWGDCPGAPFYAEVINYGKRLSFRVNRYNYMPKGCVTADLLKKIVLH